MTPNNSAQVETGWILSAHNEEKKFCFGTEQEIRQYLALLNSTRTINYWEGEIIPVFSENEDAQAFSIYEALKEEPNE